MLNPNFAIYLGNEKSNGFSGFISEGNLFLVVEVEEGLTQDRGREIIKLLKHSFSESPILNLLEFETFLANKIKEYNFPTSFSLAAGYLKGNVFYLKTAGKGQIFLQRGNDFAKIIEEEKNASGYIEKNDFFIFTTSHFTENFGGADSLKRVFSGKNPHEIVDRITPELKSKNDEGMVCLFVRFDLSQDLEFTEEPDQGTESYSEEVPSQKKSLLNNVTFFLQERYRSLAELTVRSGKKKTATFVAIIVIIVILIWSVGLGHKRRIESESREKIKSTRELIQQKLDQSEEVAYLNLSRSMVLVSEAKDELAKLKKEIGKNPSAGLQKEIEELENLIKTKENAITKKEEKTYEEFFDLAVDSKEARGDRMYLDEDSISILDRNNGIIYRLSLTKKSLDKMSFKEIKKAALVASYQDETLFFSKSEGLFKIDSANKLKRVIEKDNDWGEIIDIWIFNGNVYLLDKSKDQVYKYLVAADGYSGKTSYFKSGESVSLKNATSLAIDSSLYIGLTDFVAKYTAGVRDEFKTSFPEEGAHLTKIFTSQDVEKVYGWDKQKGAIYVLGKNGTYERQIKSSILTKTTDFFVFKDSAYMLAGEKIYKISLD